MEHQLVAAAEKALGWSSAGDLGRRFARGSLADVELCPRLLTPTRLLDIVMRRSLAAHRLQCLVDGTFVHPQNYLTQATARRGNAVPMADMRRLGQLIDEGCTLVVDEVNTYDPTFEVASRALQWWSRELVQANTYLTTGAAAGFNIHWDDHDVIVVQLSGSKNWEVRGLARPAPMFRDAAPNPEPPDEVVWEGTMEVGDVMHIPRGYWHRATRQERGQGHSLHVTFGFTKRTGVDWLTWLVDRSRRDELFRHDLERWAPTSVRAEQASALREAATDLISRHTIDDFLAARAQERPAGRHIVTHGVFGPVNAVVCVTDFPPHVSEQGNEVVIKAGQQELRFARRALPALRLLLSGTPVAVCDVTATTGVDAATLADALLAADICAEFTAELAAGYDGLVNSGAS
ncbi:cupin domain-containing protein [Streptomyces sp. MN03-5084-2B]|nr:cupin domain-containing protein [Streptomyces sp. MN03-5084-2B]